MISNKRTVLALLVLALMVALVAGQTACSTFCGTSGCSGWTRNDCNGVCYNGWTWDASNLICDFDPIADQQSVIDSSDDTGGEAYLTPSMGLSPDTCTVGAEYYGGYLAS
jgi:hypothetical protein